MTNRPEAVLRFAREIGEPIVVKPLGYACIHEEGRRRALYTHVLTDDELADLRGVETTAHLFQQYIGDKAYELRLTVVGGGDDSRMFAAAIHACSSAAAVRAAFLGVGHLQCACAPDRRCRPHPPGRVAGHGVQRPIPRHPVDAAR